jgi:hypothetical protein
LELPEQRAINYTRQLTYHMRLFIDKVQSVKRNE